MKVVIVAGGRGLRLSEVTKSSPKALAMVGGLPIIWHVIQHYRNYGYDDFIILTGYLGKQIDDYFAEQSLDFNVNVVDTGEYTSNAGRLKKIAHLLNENSTFLMTWTDGLCNVDLEKLLSFHKNNKKSATLTAVHPPSRFGHLIINENDVSKFEEKPHLSDQWINGGYFVLEPSVLNMIKDDDSEFERDILVNLAEKNDLSAFKHTGYWQCVDTVYDLVQANDHWHENQLPKQHNKQ